MKITSSLEPPRSPGRSIKRILPFLAGILLTMGCGSTKAIRGGFGQASVDELHLMSMPMALNLDSVPGVDGVILRVYAVHRSDPKTIAVREGRLEIDMFEGAMSDGITATNVPLKRWAFTPEELQSLEFKTPIGIGYSFSLRWGDSIPRQSKITVVGRYLSTEGQTVYSAPNAIAVSSP